MLQAARFSSFLFTLLAFAPAAAHVLELPNKLALARDQYFVVQQVYRGWAWLGIVVFAALFATLIHALLLRRRGLPSGLAWTAFLCIAGTQIVFWTFTFPANRETANWTSVPATWEALRVQWEYSHAASAALNLAAVIALFLCALQRQQPAEET